MRLYIKALAILTFVLAMAPVAMISKQHPVRTRMQAGESRSEAASVSLCR
jgi:hypothetical protein